MQTPKHPNDAHLDAQLFETFKQWVHSPDTALHRKQPKKPMDALETGLWEAYCAGYSQALIDNEAAQRLGAFLKNSEQGK